MRILMAGASGFLGQALATHFAKQDNEVVRLVRRAPTGPGQAQWDPYAGQLDQSVVDSADLVINLAGAPLAHWPWTEAYRREFLDSRVETTRLLAQRIAVAATSTTKAPVFLAQNGIAGYGDRGDEVIIESTPTDGVEFIAEVTRAWEAATEPAAAAGARVVVLRTGVVLDSRGGALKSMLPAFKLGAGGPIGTGAQYFSTISLRDWLDAVTFLATTESASGAYNVTGPGPSTNGEFTKELGHAVHRPTFMKVPSFPLRKFGGVMGTELLSSARVEPQRLIQAGFAFSHPTLTAQIAAALH